MKVIRIDRGEGKFREGLKLLQNSYVAFGPLKEDREVYNFKILGDKTPDLNIQNTYLSPKGIVFPQSEVMLKYTLDETKEDCNLMKEAEKDKKPKAVFGIRPCDAASFLIAKRNFDTADYKDPYWISSYEATTFAGLACNEPCSTCFCKSAGYGPFNEEGLDLLFVDFNSYFLIKVLTPKGEELMKKANWQNVVDSDKALADILSKKTSCEDKFTTSIATSNLKSKTILELYNAPFWEEESFACLNCGTCTFVCPTCWCFDIQDENCGCDGVRMKNWDSCMFPLFTLHGTGHNPRGNKQQRVRQRFMHKLKYYLDKYDKGIQCVGCGRCVRLCPVNIDIRRISEKMNGYKACN
ncbi:MAG: 4Fe-4S dicluster domain-containing protein [Desulfobacterales bacterium]|nr:4Fe-4S dicluster domain-containing protein [Desulfobacterales bacterium]MBF0397013.1 4Fe-4S dicluster domain-containing protein [Desulfobacterales bacterium]